LAEVETRGDYIAQYSWADRCIAAAIALFFAALAVFFIRSGAVKGALISTAFFSFMAYYLLHVTGTRVRFAQDEFVVRRSWFLRFSEPYGRVQRIVSKPGTVRVEFSDGRCLKLHPGLGDPDKVIAYLQARCPSSVNLE
jgi:hypothetical protein